MSDDPRPLADRLFEAYIALANVEGELYDIIHAWLTSPPLELEIGHDYYDGSVSIRGLPKDFEPTEEQLGQLRDLGFKCCRMDGRYFSLVLRAEAKQP